MVRHLALILCVLSSSQSGFTQVSPNLSSKTQFNFNLKDSQVWSSELQKIDITRMQVDSNHEIAMMRFQSADGAFKINCMKMLKGFSNAQNRAACHIESDSALSAEGITNFQSLNNGQVQKIDFRDPKDLQKFNQLVDEVDSSSYTTHQTVPILVNQKTVQVPLLKASCMSQDNCSITLVPIK